MPHTHKCVTLDLLRHGEVNAPPAFFGATDIALSPLGQEQMHSAIRLGELQASQAPWDRIISSPLQRCWRFAEQVSAQLNVPMEIEPDLREIHFGQWEGLSAQELGQRNPEEFQAYIDSPLEYTPPQGEKLADFRRRASEALHKIKHAHLDQRVLLIAHSGVIRSTLCDVLRAPADTLFSLQCPYACYSQIQYFYHPQQQSDQLVTHNSRLEISRP
ncbi:MAG: histidine phosphatase family protein [Gammaproteobacteria bacterium]|nr:histidine phosphatase family protein [Gammaproteobacteria bacterium]